MYRELLAEFPLCYVYWQKLAEHEAATGGDGAAALEEGVRAFPRSVDLWVFYCQWRQARGGTVDEMRELFGRAVQAVGTDWEAHKVWDLYLEFEGTVAQAPDRVADLYQQILQIPMQETLRYQASFKETNPTTEGWEAVLRATAETAAAMGAFEQGITRRYFHPKPLDEFQLANWSGYLTWCAEATAAGSATPAFTEAVFERCLVACAGYPDLWIRYAQWAGDALGAASARAILGRAGLHCKDGPLELHLYHAKYLERIGDADGARQVFAALAKLAPGLLQGTLGLANLERRQQNVGEAQKVYLAALERELHLPTYTFLAVQYSQFLLHVLEDGEGAKKFLRAALAVVPGAKHVWQALILLEAQAPAGGPSAGRVERVLATYEEALSGPASGTETLAVLDKLELSLQGLEWADMHADIDAYSRCLARHLERFPGDVPGAGAAPSPKRKDPAGAGPAAKLQKVEPADHFPESGFSPGFS